MDRREILKEYLREVARDLVMRGIIRNREGYTPIQILQQEPAAVFASIVKDLEEAGLSVGREIAGAVLQTVMGSIFGRHG